MPEDVLMPNKTYKQILENEETCSKLGCPQTVMSSEDEGTVMRYVNDHPDTDRETRENCRAISTAMTETIMENTLSPIGSEGLTNLSDSEKKRRTG